jgi:hypothetical protein
MSTDKVVAEVAADPCVARLADELYTGRMSVPQVLRIALAVGRLQGHYISATHLAAEAGIVCDYNATRAARVTSEVTPAPRRIASTWFRKLSVTLFSGR